MSLKLDISAAVGKRHVPFLSRHLRRAHGLLKPALVELSVALVNEKTMAQLHMDFMNIEGPTDVLTFELDHDARGRVTHGEVVVCAPYAQREAKRRGIEARMEILLYGLHGILHLCGYDDLEPAAYKIMHKKEDQLLKLMGFDPVFAARSVAPARRKS